MQDAQSDQRDRERLRAIAAGGSAGERAARELCTAYRRPLIAFFARNGVSLELAEDLVQDAFINAVRHAGAFRGESRVSTWLWSIARNRLLDHYRKERPDVHLDDDGWHAVADTLGVSSGGVASEALDECVQRGFAEFARQFPERAEVLRRVALDGWSIADAAAFLERTPAATREYLSQCRKKLKPFLEPCRSLLEDEA